MPTTPAPALPPLARARLVPSLAGWLAWLAPRIDDTMLAEIAAADYGYREADHLATLRALRDQRRIDGPALWTASEVLELVRWSQPDDPTWSPGGQGTRGHRMRLFCCAALLALADDPAIRPYCEAEPTLRPLVGSALALGAVALDPILGLLAHRLPGLAADDPDLPFFGLAILLLAAARYRAAGDGPLLAELPPWLIDLEARTRAAEHPSLIRPPWLLGLAFAADGDEVWRALAWAALIEPARPHPPAADAALRALAARLVLGAPEGPAGATG